MREADREFVTQIHKTIMQEVRAIDSRLTERIDVLGDRMARTESQLGEVRRTMLNMNTYAVQEQRINEIDKLLQSVVYKLRQIPIPGVEDESALREIEERSAQLAGYILEMENISGQLRQLISTITANPPYPTVPNPTEGFDY